VLLWFEACATLFWWILLTLAEALPTIVRETWGSGATFLIFSIAAAASLFLLLPGAASLADIFR
jgi:hypothetical protein